jgi:hypothetical protein
MAGMNCVTAIGPIPPMPGWLWLFILIGGAVALIVDRFIDRRRRD